MHIWQMGHENWQNWLVLAPPVTILSILWSRGRFGDFVQICKLENEKINQLPFRTDMMYILEMKLLQRIIISSFANLSFLIASSALQLCLHVLDFIWN